MRYPHAKYSRGLRKGARNKSVDCIIISSSATWMLKTTLTSGSDRSKPGRLHKLLCRSSGQTKDLQADAPKWGKQQQQGTQGIPRIYLRRPDPAGLRACEASAQEGPATRATMVLALWTCHRHKKNVTYPFTHGKSPNLHYSYNTTGYTDPYLKSLVQHIRRSHTHMEVASHHMSPVGGTG